MPGFDPVHVTTASASLDDARYATSAQVNRLFDRSLEKLKQTPGVEAAAVSLELPYKRLLNGGFTFADEPRATNDSTVDVTYVTPELFSTLRIPIRVGRGFTERDGPATPPVVVVNDTFVRSWAKGINPVGRRITMEAMKYEIVGIVGDVQVVNTGISFPGRGSGPLVTSPLVFLLAAQVHDDLFRAAHVWFSPAWSVRAPPSVDVAQAIQRAINDVDPLLPVVAVRNMSAVQAAATATHRLLMLLISLLAGSAVFLAAVGLYGLIAQSVAERAREFGIRLALGATPWQTIRGVAASGVTLAIVGAVAGIGLSWTTVQIVESLLWGVAAHDASTFVGVAALLLLVAAVASVLPALRILRLDPATTLRQS
jgi:hypothetical protein